MPFRFLIFFMLFSLLTSAQKTGDTVLKNCPVFILDTVTSNNFFMAGQPSTVKVNRVKNKLTITIQQRDQSFVLTFNNKKLSDRTYPIGVKSGSRYQVFARYLIRAGGQVSYVDMTSGTAEARYDAGTRLWNINVNGLLSNYTGRTVNYFKVTAVLSIP